MPGYEARTVDTPIEPVVVLGVPEAEVATLNARKVLPDAVRFKDAVFNMSAALWLIHAWASGDLAGVGEVMVDRLHQPYRKHLIPGMQAVFDAARDAGAVGVCASGSGPSILAFAAGEAEDIAAAMVLAWSRVGVESQAMQLEIDNRGLHTASA